MSLLPSSGDLPIHHLAACFGNTTNSYKFYWFLALLEHVREGNGPVVGIRELLVRMVASVWFPANRFRLSFGKQDRLSVFAREMAGVADLPGTVTLSEIEHELLHAGLQPGKQLSDLGRYVPTRFLTPWFSETLREMKEQPNTAAIRRLANEKYDEIPCLYRFLPQRNAIELHPRWLAYLQTHLEILRRFAMWSLVYFLQSRNVNVPNIGAKLTSPTQRNLKAARDFWGPLISQHAELCCIYSGEPLTVVDYDLDHFVPWSFVTHD
ncbi:MAG: HNH endonuclease, partial [Armatimonadetes bacterium]|nr:HNH endonuclease [Armatimonadota bacterium]